MTDTIDPAFALAKCKKHEVSTMLPDKTYIKLLHGRNEPDQQLDDWGFDGPTLGPISWIHITYNDSINIQFEGEDDPTDPCINQDDGICMHSDMLYYDGNFYGDWEVVHNPSEQAAVDTPTQKPTPVVADNHSRCPGYHNGLTPDQVSITAYRRDDGSVVVHVETPGIDENQCGPLLTVYLNDDLDSPLWDNQPVANNLY